VWTLVSGLALTVLSRDWNFFLLAVDYRQSLAVGNLFDVHVILPFSLDGDKESSLLWWDSRLLEGCLRSTNSSERWGLLLILPINIRRRRREIVVGGRP